MNDMAPHLASDFVSSFLAAMNEAGVKFDTTGGHPIFDGKLHRVPSLATKKRNLDVWYVGHNDEPASGAFGDYKAGVSETWTAKRQSAMTDEERGALKRRMEDTQRQRAEQLAKVNAEAAEAALAIWKAAAKASPDHPYLAGKGLPVFPGLKQLSVDVSYKVDGEPKKARAGSLVVPLMRPEGGLASVQLVGADGKKLFLKGTAKAGNYTSVGKLTDELIIGEGYATAARCHMATGLCAIVAFDSGNLLPVAKAIRKKYPDAKITVASDNDRFTKKPDGTPYNPGIDAALAAAKAIGAFLAVPAFYDDDLKSSDFDDLGQSEGLDAVATALADAKPAAQTDLKPVLVRGGTEEPPHYDAIPEGSGSDLDAMIYQRQLTHDSLALELGALGWDKNARFVAAFDCWLFWTEGRWVQESYVVARSRIRDFLRRKADDVAHEAQSEALSLDAGKAAARQRAADRLCRELGSHQFVTAVDNMARSNAASIAKPESFDANPMLLGTPGGTVDLRTGQLYPAKRSDMLTKYTAVAPAYGGAPVWMDFLERVFPRLDGGKGGDREMIAFLQRAAGYALTGETREQKLFFLHGSGRNGKGTIIQTLTAIMDDYAKSVSSATFMQQHGESHPTGLAQLKDARLVASNEIPKAATWNEEAIKSLTGGDTISARKMRQDFFEFRPQLKLFISGNNLPRFKGVGLSMRERFILVPFTQNFTDENGKRDPHLGDKLKAEWPQILQWCIEGALEWQRIGLSLPASVRQASVEYLDEEDDIAQFIAEYLEVDPAANTATSDIFPVFQDFQRSRGVHLLWQMGAMTRALGEEGNLKIEKARPTSGMAKSGSRCVIGYALKRRPSQNWSTDDYGTL